VSVLGTANTGHHGFSRVETRAVCSQCGKETTVPFKPTQGRPVLCRDCFQQRRPAASA
jgi:CxxC-x17-CxxC domain-containing protein